MSKLLNILLVSLIVLLLSNDLKAQTANTFNLKLVKDLREFKPRHNVVLWQPLDFYAGQGFVLGRKTKKDTVIVSNEVTVLYANVNDDSHDFPLDQTQNITYVELKFRSKSNSGKAVLVDGGVGKNFMSLVVELPESNTAESVVFTVYGRGQ